MALVRLELDSWLFNAALLGLKNILEINEIEFTCKDNYIEFDEDVLKDFSKYYFNYFNIQYKENLSYYTTLSNINNVLENHNKLEVSAINDLVKVAKDFLKSNSYASALLIAKYDKEVNDLIKTLGTIKKEEQILESISTLKRLKEILDIEEVKHQILVKNIMYNVLTKFLGSKSFLNPSSSKKDAVTQINADFIQKLSDFRATEQENISKKKPKQAKIQCNCCNIDILKASDSDTLSWINSVGVDSKRKGSHYYNLKCDTFICPLCSIVYLCLPAGITYYPKSKKGIFVNQNSSIKELIQANNLNSLDINSAKNEVFYKVTDIVTDGSNTIQKAINNIQIVEIDSSESRMYKFTLLDKQVLTTLRSNRRSLINLVNKYVKVTSTYYLDIYQQVIYCIVNKVPTYNLLTQLIRLDYNNSYVLKTILKINIRSKDDMSTVDKYINAGKHLRKSLLQKGNENRIQSIHYKLHSALSTNNFNLFMQTITQVYFNNRIPMQMDFNELFKEYNFKKFGYAFILGLSEIKIEDNMEGDNKNGNI